jgi:AraC family transcriptional regulator
MYTFFTERGSGFPKFDGEMDRILLERPVAQQGVQPLFLLPLRVIFHEFPDLVWLKKQIAQGFDNQLGWGDHRLESKGFPSVIIHTIDQTCYRPDIKGPFSIFLNLRGSSLCSVEGDTRCINDNSYFVSNRAQPYTLQIEEGSNTETFNIHFGDYFSSAVLHSLITPVDNILDNGNEHPLPEVSFFNHLYHRDTAFEQLVARMISAHHVHQFDQLLFEEQLTDLLTYLLRQQRHIIEAIRSLPSVKASTRSQLYRQLSRAMDLIHASADAATSLEELATEACMSKYHFLRLFRIAYGYSPHQYIQHLRIERACKTLSKEDTTVSELADLLGFSDSQSFTRLFTQRMGVSPTRYRAMAK